MARTDQTSDKSAGKPIPAKRKKTVAVTTHKHFEPVLGPQGQRLIPTIMQSHCGTEGLSACMVVMPPGKTSRPHYHAKTEIIVVVIEGYAATLIGEEQAPYFHGPGEFIYIPEGVVHTAVNLSTVHRLVAIEMRTDPHFNEDVVMSPELEAKMQAAAARLHEHYVDGTLDLPKHWNPADIGPFRFPDAE